MMDIDRSEVCARLEASSELCGFDMYVLLVSLMYMDSSVLLLSTQSYINEIHLIELTETDNSCLVLNHKVMSIHGMLDSEPWIA